MASPTSGATRRSRSRPRISRTWSARSASEGFAGVNVTVPHKLAALALADRASTAASEIGAANTLTFTDAGIEAENTDAGGLIAALPEPPGGRRALVLGAGGSARAAVWALGNAGASVSIWNRTAARAEALAAEFGVAHERDRGGEPLPIADYDLLVNCTTVGLAAASATAGGVCRPEAASPARRFDCRRDRSWWTWPTGRRRHR